MNLVQRYLASFRGLSREIWTLSIVGLVNRMGMMVLPFLLLYLTGEMDYSASEAGLVLSVFGVGTLLGIYLGGSLSDRYGHRRVQLWSLFSSGAMLVLMGQLPAGPGLVASVFLFGLCSDAYRPANMAAIAHHSTESERTRAYGLYRLAINLGWSIGPAVGGILALFNYELLFWIDGLTTLLAGVYLMLALPEHKATAPAQADAKSKQPESARALPAQDSPWEDRAFVVALFLLFLQCLAFFQLSSTLPLFLTEQRGLGTDMIGYLMLVNTLLIVFLEMPLIARLDRYPKLKLVAISCLFVGAGFGLLPWATSLVLIVMTFVLWTIGEMLSAPLMSTWVSTRANAGNRGRYMAAFGMCFSVGQVVAPVAGTWTYEHLGPNWPWYGALALGLISFMGFQILRRLGDK